MRRAQIKTSFTGETSSDGRERHEQVIKLTLSADRSHAIDHDAQDLVAHLEDALRDMGYDPEDIEVIRA